jgi:hypothetical protein
MAAAGSGGGATTTLLLARTVLQGGLWMSQSRQTRGCRTRTKKQGVHVLLASLQLQCRLLPGLRLRVYVPGESPPGSRKSLLQEV